MKDDFCHYGNASIVRTSWTNRNPGHRFSSCARSKEKGGCNFFVWNDPPTCARSLEIIPGLLRRLKIEEAEATKRGKREKILWISLLLSWCFIMYLL
ncbi:DNA-(apurinic or apyrimidinic site) lyase [Handroanthus impetiginosus]|uniref:DNA-(Apurinic or apyrimidinic site) lyase n=1 Tax=Handroanthus impetiginosus TaxID=429701 RepID=A0A2G9GXF5_9LAMI|nr:DNA-(apurinic or apyrimidinic site) lyase [Handroanthus impetiginosus]